MKDFDLIYDPQEESSLCLFNNIDLQSLSEPIIVQRDDPVPEEAQIFQKKKSEVIDHEQEEYVQLREQEQEPLLVTDSESRTFSGKMQDISSNSGIYFALLNTGTCLKLVPINKWYRFMQRNQFSDGNVEALERKIATQDVDEESGGTDNEIDFEQTFDDDDGGDNMVIVESSKKLNNAGEKLQSIVESYEAEESSKPQPEIATEEAIDSPKKPKTSGEMLTKEVLHGILCSESMSAKELLRRISAKFLLGDYEKKLIREFIHESCVLIEDSRTGEKVFKLKSVKKC